MIVVLHDILLSKADAYACYIVHEVLYSDVLYMFDDRKANMLEPLPIRYLHGNF